MAYRELRAPGLLRVGNNALHDLAAQLAEKNFDVRRIALCGGGIRTRPILEQVSKEFQRHGSVVFPILDVESSISDVAALAAVIIEQECTLVVSVGGGRVIDVGKLAAARTDVSFVSAPTTIAHDGIASPVSTLWDATGARRSYAACIPAAVVVDTGLISASPARTRSAGLGDLLSNLCAVRDWQRVEPGSAEEYDDLSAMMAKTAALRAMMLPELETEASLTLLAEGLVLSGLAMSAAGTSRPCSGAEHLISHSLDALLGPAARLHGEQVALGTLIAFELLEEDSRDVRRVFTDCGVPTSPADLGLDMDVFARAIVEAPATRPQRRTVLTDAIGSYADALKICRRVFP